MKRTAFLLPALLFILASGGALSASAAQVELEIYTEDRASPAAAQDWLRVLSEAGIGNLRIRGSRVGDRPGIETQGAGATAIHVVTGAITSGGELITPGGRFRPGQAKDLARWLNDVAAHGPPDQRPPKAAFGLDAALFEQAHADLAKIVGFTTAGLSRSDFVRRLAGRLTGPIRVPSGPFPGGADDRIVEELSELSCGAALAYVVRPLGMCLVPRAASRGCEYMILPSQPNTEAWPVGWKSEKRQADLVPALYQFLDINVQGVPVATVLKAVGERTKLPILFDYNAMARHGIEPDKTVVNLPNRRTTYSLLLRNTLFQAGLKDEVRIDEAGKPFLWITTVKPIP
jgi:hypothetical protein